MFIHNEISPLIKYDNTYSSQDYDKARLNDKFIAVLIIDNGVHNGVDNSGIHSKNIKQLIVLHLQKKMLEKY